MFLIYIVFFNRENTFNLLRDSISQWTYSSSNTFLSISSRLTLFFRWFIPPAFSPKNLFRAILITLGGRRTLRPRDTSPSTLSLVPRSPQGPALAAWPGHVCRRRTMRVHRRLARECASGLLGERHAGLRRARASLTRCGVSRIHPPPHMSRFLSRMPRGVSDPLHRLWRVWN